MLRTFLSQFIFQRVSCLRICRSWPFYVCGPQALFAQQPPSRDNRYEVIDAEEGQRRIRLPRQRLDGDYRFRFELEHCASRQKPRYYGTMWGSWNELGPSAGLSSQWNGTRLSQTDSCVEMIFQMVCSRVPGCGPLVTASLMN